jgi:tetratricopeptide (TPR) repeat protein
MGNFLTTVSAAAVALGVFTTAPAPASAESLAGSYLAARSAAIEYDFEAAAKYYAIAIARDPENLEVMENAVLAYIGMGDIERAVPLSTKIIAAGFGSQAARMALAAADVEAGNFTALAQQEIDVGGISQWVDGLVVAWALIGSDNVDGAMAQFDAVSTEAGMGAVVSFHKALALATVGRYAEAEELFADAASAAGSRRAVLARVEILSQLSRNADAITLIETNFSGSTDPELDMVIERLESGDTLPFTHAPTAQAGIAEVFYTFAALLRAEQANDYYTLLYARIARYLRPDHVDALLLSAALLEDLGQHQLAIAEYRSVDVSDAAFHVAELGRAAALRRLEKPGQAIEVLEQLTRSHGEIAAVHAALGDALRAQDDDQEAIAAYTVAMDLTAESDTRMWFLHFSRGIAYSQDGDSVAAEADFRAALAINPEQPQVLNYLGYSLVEEQRKLDEALDMIERAVAASPDSGYIVDSLGWVYYRLGRYEEAVVQMERAVELEAVDPVVNDHLGDVYWAVGRTREAQFQWKRALSFIEFSKTDTEADPERIRRKLEVGLDAVLAEEGAAPLRVANDG